MRRYGLLFLIMAFCFASALLAQHGGEGSGEAAGAGSSELLWKWANFALLAGGLGFLVYKKGGAFFRSRGEAIRAGIEEADKLRCQAEARVAEMEARLKNLQGEVESLKQNARQEIEAENERLRLEMEARVSKIREQAEQEIAGAAKTALHSVRAHAAGLAVELAAAKIRSLLTTQADQSLVTSYLDDIERAAGSKPGKELN